MHSGRYQNAKGIRRKKPIALIVSLVLILVTVIGGTVAYLKATTDRVTNTFTPAQVEITPTEETTPTTKSDIQFQNTGDVPVYIRATLVIYWKDSDENIVPQPEGGQVAGGVVQSGWTENNGIYYYDSKVDPKEWTTDMLSTITVTCPAGYTCHIDVHAEAIQAEGLGATYAVDAWVKAQQLAN